MNNQEEFVKQYEHDKNNLESEIDKLLKEFQEKYPIFEIDEINIRKDEIFNGCIIYTSRVKSSIK